MFLFLAERLVCCLRCGVAKGEGMGRTRSVGYDVMTVLYYIAYTTSTIMQS